MDLVVKVMIGMKEPVNRGEKPEKKKKKKRNEGGSRRFYTQGKIHKATTATSLLVDSKNFLFFYFCVFYFQFPISICLIGLSSYHPMSLVLL
jgi:hypothetical protein